VEANVDGLHGRDCHALSFLSLILDSHLPCVTIDDPSSNVPRSINKGAYFEVFITRINSLFRSKCMTVRIRVKNSHSPLPETIAVKVPNVQGAANNRRSWKIVDLYGHRNADLMQQISKTTAKDCHTT
jgi:hypothetical protein